jgi:hypothetical protein
VRGTVDGRRLRLRRTGDASRRAAGNRLACIELGDLPRGSVTNTRPP